MDKVGEVYGLRRFIGDRESRPVHPQHRTPDMRKAAEADIDTPTSAPKQRRYDTPVRRTLGQMVPMGSSPAVTVSTYIEYHMNITYCRSWSREKERHELTPSPSLQA